MDEIRKFQTLELDQTYQVLEYDKNICKTPYGESFILMVSEEQSEKPFKVFGTRLLTKYIQNEKIRKLFNFTVKEKNGNKYPVIEGYNPRKWIKLA
jgi:hypothetical protein